MWRNIPYLVFTGVFPYFFNYALHCGNKKHDFRRENGAWADTIIHGDSLGKNFVLKSDFGFEEPFLHFRGKLYFVKCNKL